MRNEGRPRALLPTQHMRSCRYYVKQEMNRRGVEFRRIRTDIEEQTKAARRICPPLASMLNYKLEELIKFWIISPLIFLVLTSCNQICNEMTNTFIELERSVGRSQNLLKEFKTLSRDSLYRITYLFRGELNNILNDIDLEEISDEEENCLIKNINPEFRYEVLQIAFQDYLNGRKIRLKKINKEGVKLEEQWIIAQRKKDKETWLELMNIVKLNDSRCQIGDTLNLIFHLDKDQESDHRMIYYRNYPWSKDFSTTDDILKMKGLLLAKLYGENYLISRKDKDFHPTFRVKIIDVSEEFYDISASMVKKIGDSYDIPLELYGLEIK